MSTSFNVKEQQNIDISIAVAVKHENFKTCDQSGFCKRNRAYADTVHAKGTSWKAPYRIEPSTLKTEDGAIKATILKDVEDTSETVRLPLIIKFLKSGVARIEIDEEKRQRGEIELRHGSKARKERYNEAANYAIIGGLESGTSKVIKTEKDRTVIGYGPEQKYQAVIHYNPFKVDFIRDDQVQMQLNGDGLMNIEHWRPKIEKPPKEEAQENSDSKEGEESKSEEAKPSEEATPESGEDESTWWDESFGGSTDSKPRGPESIGLDITFPGYSHVFGIPEHTGPLSLKETR